MNEGEICRQGQQSKRVMDTQLELPEPQARQLCTSCAAPNRPNADFCVKCGAPISWYSKIGPFESIFAQGFILREATGRPRRLIVVLGIWLIFLPQLFAGLVFIQVAGPFSPLFGSGPALISIVIIWRTTRNYLSEKSNKLAADQTDSEADTKGA
jgi:hypothetical protein